MTDIEPDATPRLPVGVGVYERPRAAWLRTPAGLVAVVAALVLLIFAAVTLARGA